MNTILFSIAIAGFAFWGFVAKVVFFIAQLYFLSFIIFGAIKGKSEPKLKDLFKAETFGFFVFFSVITGVIFLCMFILYGPKK